MPQSLLTPTGGSDQGGGCWSQPPPFPCRFRSGSARASDTAPVVQILSKETDRPLRPAMPGRAAMMLRARRSAPYIAVGSGVALYLGARGHAEFCYVTTIGSTSSMRHRRWRWHECKLDRPAFNGAQQHDFHGAPSKRLPADPSSTCVIEWPLADPPNLTAHSWAAGMRG